jgi:citrate lyase beta subunit
MAPDALATCRSALFVPGNRPDRYAKAAASGADAIILDLEDAVAPADKSSARASALAFLAEPCATRGVYRILRLNALSTLDGVRDLVALAESDARPDAVMLAKCDSPHEARQVASVLGTRQGDPALVLLVETARGLACVEALAEADSRVTGLMFGGVDLAGELRAEAGWEALLYARSRVVAAAALRGLAVLDVPNFDLESGDGPARDAAAARRLGFTGKAAIHPRHVAAIHAAFAPDPDAVAEARATLAAVGAGGAIVVAGRMADNAMLRAARRTLELAERAATDGAR